MVCMKKSNHRYLADSLQIGSCRQDKQYNLLQNINRCKFSTKIICNCHMRALIIVHIDMYQEDRGRRYCWYCRGNNQQGSSDSHLMCLSNSSTNSHKQGNWEGYCQEVCIDPLGINCICHSQSYNNSTSKSCSLWSQYKYYNQRSYCSCKSSRIQKWILQKKSNFEDKQCIGLKKNLDRSSLNKTNSYFHHKIQYIRQRYILGNLD